MAYWTSWLVLAVCTVITQSFPRSDTAEYQIPNVPFGKRAQYYVLHDDGDFKYGYDTGDGTYESAVKMGGGDLTGFYGYNDALGDKVRVDYTAGVEGFNPTGTNIPVAPARARSGALSGSPAVGAPAHVLVKGVAAPVRPTEEADVRSSNAVDGSYSFSYVNSDSSRTETADSSNNVVGAYTFVADDGVNRQIRYKAGSLTGYVAEGDSIPVSPIVDTIPSVVSVVPSQPRTRTQFVPAPPVTLYSAPAVLPVAVQYDSRSADQSSTQPRGDASYSFKYQTGDSAREETADKDLNVRGRYSFVADDGIERRVKYIAGSGTGFVAEGDHLPVAPESVPVDFHQFRHQTHESVPATVPVVPISLYAAPTYANEIAALRDSTSVPRGDASYQFQYDTGDSSRSEISDKDLNVQGSYSFVGDDGQRRTVTYTAGSSGGFVAEGDHLPKDVPVSPEFKSSSAFSAPVQPRPSSFPSYVAPTFKTGQSEGADITHSQGTDGSYSFSYSNSDSSRSETADASNNVVGSYSFVADDGVNRQIRYKAGAETGYVAEGDSIPTIDASSGQPSAPVSPAIPYSAPTVYSAPATLYSGPVRESAEAASVPVAVTRQGSQGQGEGAAYSFSYKTGDSSRSETADRDLNIEGSYSFVADDGVQRSVNYKAGSATGFVAEGSHLPVAPDVPSPVTSDKQSDVRVLVKSAPTAPVVSHEVASVRSQSDNAGGYSFSYTNADSSRSETADASNNVVGQYSFVADDGINRSIRYKAGSGTGYVAEGDSIPVAPEVSATAYSAPASVAVVHQHPQARGNALFSIKQEPSFKSQGAHVIPPGAGVAPKAHVYSADSSSGQRDASYSFNYVADGSSRDETADRDLNVKGRYSYVADDGKERTVTYKAGSGIGFVAEGDIHPDTTGVAGASSAFRAAFPSTSIIHPSPASSSSSGYAYEAPAGPVLAIPRQQDAGSASSQGYRYKAPAGPALSLPSGRTSLTGENFRLNQYQVVPGRNKFGYVFTEI